MEFVDQQVLEYKEEGGKKQRQTMSMAEIYAGISDSSDDEGNKDQADEAVDAEFKEVDDDKDK